jgi:hypothetical protein
MATGRAFASRAEIYFVGSITYACRKRQRIRRGTRLLTPQDAANVTSRDAVLLYSDKPVDCEHTDKHEGEVKRVVAVNKQIDVITLDDQVHDASLTWEYVFDPGERRSCQDQSDA